MKIQKKYNDELLDEILRPEWSGTYQFYSVAINANHKKNLMEFLSSNKIHRNFIVDFEKKEILKE